MVRVNGRESAAVLTNIYPDAVTGRAVLHLHIDVPESESILWETGNPLTIEADWRLELGGVVYATHEGLTEILAGCSVQGLFLASIQSDSADGLLGVALVSIGTLKTWERGDDSNISTHPGEIPDIVAEAECSGQFGPAIPRAKGHSR